MTTLMAVPTHSTAEVPISLVMEMVARVKPVLGKTMAPPAEMKVLGGRLDDGDDGDAEPPEAQGPEEDGDDDGNGLDDTFVEVQGAGHVAGHGGQPVGHADDGEGGKGRRPDAHEETGAVLAVRQTRLHEAADHVGVHEDGDGKAEALAGQAGDENGHGGDVGLGVGDDRGNGACQHDGEDGQNPGRHHGLQAEAVGGKDEAVLANGEEEGYGEVGPEGALDGPYKRRVVLGNGIALGAGDDCGKGKEKGREEKALAGVLERVGQVTGVQEEAGRDEDADEAEDDEVDDVDDETDGLEAGELVGLGEDEQRETAGAHGQRVPGPCEVVEALADGQLGPVGVKDVDAARVGVPGLEDGRRADGVVALVVLFVDGDGEGRIFAIALARGRVPPRRLVGVCPVLVSLRPGSIHLGPLLLLFTRDRDDAVSVKCRNVKREVACKRTEERAGEEKGQNGLSK